MGGERTKRDGRENRKRDIGRRRERQRRIKRKGGKDMSEGREGRREKEIDRERNAEVQWWEGERWMGE